MKKGIKNRIQNGKHRLTGTTQNLLVCLLFFLCGSLCGCTRKQADDMQPIQLETDLADSGGTESSWADASGNEGIEASGVDSAPQEPKSGQTSEGTSGVQHSSMNEEADLHTAGCFVHIYGAVESPGVYELENGSRIFQAIGEAGGFTEDACRDYVNQARPVSDGMKIWIPTSGEASELSGLPDGGRCGISGPYGDSAGVEAPAGNDVLTESDAGGPVNINTATIEELCNLNGIGESRAGTIIAYRESHGAFQKKEDIMKVTGIKENSYEKIKDQITVGGE